MQHQTIRRPCVSAARARLLLDSSRSGPVPVQGLKGTNDQGLTALFSPASQGNQRAPYRFNSYRRLARLCPTTYFQGR